MSGDALQPSEAKRLFRSKALERLSVGDSLDSALRVTSRPLWLALATCAIALSAALVWAIFGSAPTTVQAEGVLLPAAGVVEVDSTAAGTVTALDVGVGVQVAAGEEVAEVTTLAGTVVPVDADVSGTVDEQFVSQGSFVGSGTPVAELLPAGSPMSGVMFVNAAAGKVVTVGMKVNISPSTAPAAQYGAIKGTVSFVSPLPVTDAQVQSLVGPRQGLINLASALGAPLEIVVTLQRDLSTPSGYAWTSGNGPNFPVTPGTILSGTVRVSKQRPIQTAF